MQENYISYQAGDIQCKGYLVSHNKDEHLPGILVVHAWHGQDEFAREKARALAKLGYIVLAVDMFGNGKNATDDDEAMSLIGPLYADRELMQKRVVAAFDTLVKQPGVDKYRIGAIGFCFGGLTVIELLRSGTPVKSVVSFHGILSHLGAKTVPLASNIKGSILILHGYDDPRVPMSDVLDIQQELNDAKIDWQMNIYGLTSHAFTNPNANDKNKGLVYSDKANKRSWIAMNNFFQETLQ